MTFSRSQAIRSVTVLALLIGNDSMFAQASHWNAPSAVYVHDSVGKTIRPLVGILGSSYPGAVVLDGIDWASFALNHKSALISHAGALAWIPDLSVSDLGANLESHSLPDVPLPQQVIWAADSTRAAILTAASPQLAWLGHFDGTPRLAASWALDGNQTGWALLAADTNANQVLLTSQEGDLRRLWLASPTNAPVLVTGLTNPTAAAFAQSGTTAFVADSATHQVVSISGLNSTNPVIAPLVASEQYVADPAAIALCKDGSRLFLADGGGKVIRAFEIATGTLSAELPVPFAPTSLTAVSSNSFLVGGRDQKEQPFFFLDTQTGGRVLFVPVGQ
jgi:DNA-binding beta-propeller fold protein YncE